LTPAVLAIDGGNSKTDVALVADDGTLVAWARGPGINAHEVGVDQTVLILDAVVKLGLDHVHAPAAAESRLRADYAVAS
jgi:N-acetylglucosamine kinase-like BadF-type ATPase